MALNPPVVPGDRVLASPSHGAAPKWGEVDECRSHWYRHKSGALSMFWVYMVRFTAEGTGRPYVRALGENDIKEVTPWSK